MGQKLVVGPLNRGLRNDVTPFNLDNDSFPTLINAYQWRSRVKRKRGTSLLGRLRQYIGTTDGGAPQVITISPQPILTGIVSFVIGSVVLTDPGTTPDPGVQTLLTTNPAFTGTLNRVTGALSLSGFGAGTSIIYYSRLPVMGLEDFISPTAAFPGTIAFDTTYAYNISTSDPYAITTASFYKNLSTGTYTGYIQKTNWTPLWWNGQDYQQFWTVNYAGAMWATNGIETPFDTTNIGMPFNTITAIDYTSGAPLSAGPPAIADITMSGPNPLVIGDFVFINEVQGLVGINFQTGYVIASAGAVIRVEFPNATLSGARTGGGIVQYLTNRSSTTKDCIRWYDGDPTNQDIPTTFSLGHGWVNYCPPLSQGVFSIGGAPADRYYLVGARMIVTFKDRLLFLGPVIQSSTGSPIYLQDTVIWSQNGTPYYTASYTNSPSTTVDTPASASNVFNGILVPDNQTATSSAMFEDQTGFGGFISAGLDERLNTVSTSRDALIMGFDNTQTRFVFTGSETSPFEFYLINSELGSSSTFSTINVDKGVFTRGNRGFLITSQSECSRIDTEIPDEVFEFSLKENGIERVCAQRDFQSEWIYFTYPGERETYKFPNQTLLYNYRDVSWAIFYEAYTTYGQFKRQTGFTWATVGATYPSWSEWNSPWSAGTSNLLQPEIIAGNQQGFVVFRNNDTLDEATSIYIQNIAANVITSPDHVLNDDDFIIITGVLGTAGSQLNGKIFQVENATQNTFTLDPVLSLGTYLGGGLIQRLSVPQIQTKQFPMAWDMARKTRIGAQQYLLTTTEVGQIALLIFLSQNGDDPYNDGLIVPDSNSQNDSLIYSTVLYTCPESTNIGLTAANTNLQMPTAIQQEQIWHRVNTSLLGDTIQLGFTISDAQMKTYSNIGIPLTITGASQASQCVLEVINSLSAGDLVKISSVIGMTQLNFTETNYNYYLVVSRTDTSVTILVDSTGFTAYDSGGTLQRVALLIQSSEVELHGIIMDISPSMLLA